MTTHYSDTSPYYSTEQTSWYLDVMDFRNIAEDSTDYYIQVSSKFSERPDLLSYDQYGVVDYWWIFAILNPDKIVDPIYDLKEGMILRLPTLTRLSNLLG